MGWIRTLLGGIAAPTQRMEEVVAREIGWSTVIRALGWLVALTFVLATVLTLLLAFDVLGPQPERGDDFIEFKLAEFAWEEERWVLDLPASALFAIGFLALAGLGSAVARFADTSDSRRNLVASSFVLGGGFGAASELLWIGAKPIATSTRYCDCGLLAEEIMSRTMILETVGGIQTWLISGALALLAVGAMLIATMPLRALPQWWRRLNVVLAALAVIGILLPLFDAYPFDVLLTLLIAGILLPIWAIWLARRPADFWTPSIR